MKENQLIAAIGSTLTANKEIPALSDFKGVTYTYGEVAARIARIHLLYEAASIKPGDKVALCAKNSAAWAVTFLATVTYGAVPVPLLHDFHPDQIEHLTTHSEARLLFTEQSIANDLDHDRMPDLKGILLLGSCKAELARDTRLAKAAANLDRLFAEMYPGKFDPSKLKLTHRPIDDLALINYTSGSSGNPKGVMLSYRNLWSNVDYGLRNIPFFHPGDAMLSMLPLAHMYGLVFELLFPFCRGCHITFLGRVPSPKILLQAFAETRPQLVITVPLVIEKIVKGKVFPTLRKPLMRLLLAIPPVRKKIYAKVRAQLLQAFGGNLKQLILGGAPVAADVEKLLRDIRFPFTVGYGMTECAPLVTYEWWETQRPHSCGRLCDGMEARIESPDPAHKAGVLFVKGDNVMKGYYKNPKATAEALTPDGWLNTGDLCTRDADGYIYIHGRDKNMILGPSGQNIYPEEIEAKLNELPLVGESIVLDRDGRIIALVHPNYEQGRMEGLTDQQTEKRVMDQLPVLNKELPGYSRVSAFEIHTDEFAKTPKHSIRRFLYK